MERRFFLTSLLKTAVAIPLIGTGTSIFLDSTKVFNPLTASDILAIELNRMRPKIESLFDKDDIYLGGIGGGNTTALVNNMIVNMKLRPGGYFK